MLHPTVTIPLSYTTPSRNIRIVRSLFYGTKRYLDFLGQSNAGVPGGLTGGPRAYQDQFRGFKSHRVHARRDFFLHEEID